MKKILICLMLAILCVACSNYQVGNEKDGLGCEPADSHGYPDGTLNHKDKKQRKKQRTEAEDNDQQDCEKRDQIDLQQIAPERIADIIGGHESAGDVIRIAVILSDS